MHLSQAEVNNRTTLQLVTAVHLVSAEAYAVTIQKLLLLLCLLWHRIIGGPNGNPFAESVVVTSLYFVQVTTESLSTMFNGGFSSMLTYMISLHWSSPDQML
jgi:hypothetical protein